MRIVAVQLFQLPSEMAHAIQIVSTAGALADRGHEVALHVRGPGPAAAEAAARDILGRALPDGLTISVAGAHKGLAGLGFRARLAADLRGGRACFYARQRRQTLSALWLRRALASRVPVVFEFHNIEHLVAREDGREDRARAVERQERKLVQSVEGLVAISAPLRDDLVRTFELEREPALIPDGVDLGRFRGIARPLVDDGAETVRAVYAGGLFAHKGVESLVECMPFTPGRVHLRIVGGNPPGELDRLRERARELGVGERVTFAGQVAPGDVAVALAKADLILLPASDQARSQRYTSPLKLFESMATGAPIVAAPSPAFATVLEDGRTAFLAGSNAPADLGRAIERVLGDTVRARAIGRAAQSAAEDYGWERRAERIEAVLRAAAESKGVALT